MYVHFVPDKCKRKEMLYLARLFVSLITAFEKNNIAKS